MSLTRASKVPSAFCVPAILSPGAPPRSPSDQKAYSRDRETAGSREKDTHHNHPNRSQTKPDRGAGEARGGGQRRGQQKRQELGGRGRDPPAGGGRAREGPGPATIGSIDPRGHVRIPRHSELEKSSTRKSKTLLLRVECHFFFGDFPPRPGPCWGGWGGRKGGGECRHRIPVPRGSTFTAGLRRAGGGRKVVLSPLPAGVAALGQACPSVTAKRC